MSSTREDEPVEMVLGDEACARGMKCAWGLGKQLFVYPGENPPQLQESHKGQLTCPVVIHDVRWDTHMHGPIVRKLVNEAHNVFMVLQGKVQEMTGGTTLRPHLIKASRQYRSVVKACSMNLHTASLTSFNEEEKQELSNQVQIYEMIELIWSLCEILFVDLAPGGVVVGQLLEWLHWNFPEVDSQAMEVVKHEPPEAHEDYWNVVYKFVLQGRLDNARKMLSLHSKRSTECFQSIEEIMRKMPLQTLLKNYAVMEFDLKWRHWKEDCERRIEAGEFSANKDIEVIARILSGEDAIFSRMKDLCETWYHMLVSKTLYQNPTIKVFDLHYFVQNCLDEYGSTSRIGQLDNILMAALEFDIHQVIKDSSTHFGSWWFVAHLADLLHHAGCLDAQKLAFGSNLREYLVLEYASSLMSHQSLWQVGVDYLDKCSEFGRKYLELYIEHVPLDTDRKARKVLKICEQREMQDQVRSICKIMGMRCLQNGRLGSALSWCLRSKDVGFATMITEKFLTDYNDRGDFSSLDLIDNLGPSMLLSKRLIFLGKYREFHKLYEDGDFFAAASLLLSLLTSRLTPKPFLITLLTDALPMLEAEEVIFSSSQTYELMYCLENITLAQQKEKPKTDREKGAIELENEKLNLMRLALSRNLARAILREGTVKLKS